MHLKLFERPSIQTRGEVKIFLFPSRPYWFSANTETEAVINALAQGGCLSKLVKEVSVILKVSLLEAGVAVADVRRLLEDHDLLIVNGKPSNKHPPLQPHQQLQSAENMLVVAATNKCPCNCFGCYANAHTALAGELRTDEVINIIDQLADMPWRNERSRISFTGGEFFTRADAVDLIRHAYTTGFNVIVSTTTLPMTTDTIGALREFPRLKLSVSLDGPDRQTHEYIRGLNTFDRTIGNIRHLTVQGTAVGVNMLVHRGNFNRLEETIELASQLGVRAFNCLNIMLVGRAISAVNRKRLERVTDADLYRRMFTIVRSKSKYNELLVNSSFASQVMAVASGVKSHYCGIGTNRALYIRPDGSVYPCPNTAAEQFHLGNTRQVKLGEIWKGSPVLAELRDLNVDTMNPHCAQCDVRYFCGGSCRGENIQAGGGLSGPHIKCVELRQAIFEIMWILTEDPRLFIEKTKGLYHAAWA